MGVVSRLQGQRDDLVTAAGAYQHSPLQHLFRRNNIYDVRRNLGQRWCGINMVDLMEYYWRKPSCRTSEKPIENPLRQLAYPLKHLS